MSFFKNLTSDWLKTKHTPIRIILVTVPLFYSVFMLWYAEKLNSISAAYNAFFQVISIFMPIAAGLLCGLMGMLEENAGNFNVMLGLATTRTRSYVSKFILLIIMTAFSVLFSTAVLLIGMKMLNFRNIQAGLFFKGALLVILGSLFLYGIHLLLSLAFGMGASIAAGGGGFLIAAIFGGTVIGDKIWQFVPWTYAVRLSGLPKVFIHDFTMPADLSAGTPAYMSAGFSLTEFYKHEFNKGIAAVIVSTILILSVGIIWFIHWEGRKTYE